MIEFSWIKAHAGYLGNKLPHRVPKDAARDQDIVVGFEKNPKTTI